jgi:hypothetical protein
MRNWWKARRLRRLQERRTVLKKRSELLRAMMSTQGSFSAWYFDRYVTAEENLALLERRIVEITG